MKKIILASKSPRREELLRMLGYDFEIMASNSDEIIDFKKSKSEIVKKLALDKAKAIKDQIKEDKLILGFDTIVVIDNEILGKPKDKEDCIRMLSLLNDHTHFVYTGCAIINGDEIDSFYSKASVTFDKMTDEEIINYANTTEPYDKAGAYAVQGYASRFIKKINGDYFTIMGLPVNLIYQKLKQL